MRCVIHIGTEKTATTLLQNWLYENEQSLSAQGVALTRAGGSPNNRKLVAFFREEIDDYLRGAGVTTAPEREKFFAGFADELRAELSRLARDHHTVILTSEHFHSRLKHPQEMQALKRFLDAVMSEYRVICYFREQARVRTSLYSTALKVNSVAALEEFQAGISPRDHYYNYLTFFRKWESAFGMDSLRPRLFEPDRIEAGDIRLDFLKTVLPDVDASGLSFASRSANESLSPPAAAAFRAINAARPQFVGHFPDPTPQVFKETLQEAGVLDTGETLPDPRQAEVYKAFHETNLDFFERYFGERRNLFTPPQDIPEGSGALSPGEDGMVTLISRLAQIENLVVIRPDEINALRDLATRLFSRGVISANEAVTLLKIAHRARPKGGWLKDRIDEILQDD